MLRASTSSTLRAAGAATSATRMRSSVTTAHHHLQQQQQQLLKSRSFFSFASPAQALVKSHSETKVVPFSPEEMFDVVADVNKYHEFLPFCVESRVLRRPNENVMEAALRIGFKVFTESYTSRVIMNRPEKIVVKSIESPTFKRIESEWVFRRTGNPNTCAIDFKVTFEVASFLHANAINLFFDDVAVAQLSAFIGRARKLHGSRPRPTAATQQVPAQATKGQQATPMSQGESTFPLSQAMAKSIGSTSFASAHSASPATEIDGAKHECPLNGLTAAQRAAQSVKTGMSPQHFHDLEALFDHNSVDSGKMYLNGFVTACHKLSGEYQDFKEISENSALAAAIFSSLATSEQPKEWLNLDEFVVGVYLMTKGTIEEKVQSLFHAIDTLCDGKISREELTTAMQRRIRTVKKIFPKLLHDQVQIQMQHENVTALSVNPDKAMSSALGSLETLMEEIEREIPLAVNQIFLEADLNQDDFITQDEWLFAWQAHPEFVELMTIDGMKKFAQWASVVHSDEEEQQSEDEQEELDTRLTHVD